MTVDHVVEHHQKLIAAEEPILTIEALFRDKAQALHLRFLPQNVYHVLDDAFHVINDLIVT